MKSRILVATIIALLAAAGASAEGASAAKPVLWLKSLTSAERAQPGTTAFTAIDIEGCSSEFQDAALASDGKPVDKVTVSARELSYSECPSGFKASGDITSVSLAPSGEVAAMTVKSAIHVLVAPWCVYSVPKTVTFPASGSTQGTVNVTSALDKNASFGSCASSRSVTFVVSLIDRNSAQPFRAEVVG